MDKKVTAIIILVVGVALAAGGVFFFGSSVEAPTTTQQAADGITEPQSTPTFTAAEVAVHSTETDCWTIVGGSVYDITPYVPFHPGGVEILRACGADGTTLFDSRTTEKGEVVGSGTPHSSEAISQLGQFFLGTLEN